MLSRWPALAFAAVLVAQGQAPTFRARADLVQVDVVVVDGEGNPVRGLHSADFVLRDRNKPQAIASFDEIAHDRRETAEPLPPGIMRDVSNNQDAQSGRLIVMVLDDLHVYKERTDRARAIARQVLADLGPQSSMAVLFTSQKNNTLVTQDQAVLAAAIDTFKGRQSWRRPHQARDNQSAPRLDPEMDSLAMLDQVSRAQTTSLQDFFENLTQYKTLQDAARLLGGNDARRKAFVLVSEGIGKDLSGIFDPMSPLGNSPTQTAEATARALLPTGYHDVALIDMMEAMRRSNVATYAIDPRGRVDSADLPRECAPALDGLTDPCSSGLSDFESVVRQAQSGLRIMSEASGGFAVTDTDDFTSGIRKIVDDLDHYYLLGFYPADAKGDGYRRLNVQIPGHPDWHLRFRRGYVAGGRPPAPKNGSPMLALAGGVLPNGDLPLRLTAIPVTGAPAGTTRLALTLEVTAPVAALRDPDGKLRDTLRYEVLVVDEKKARVRSLGGLEGKLQLSPAGRPEEMPTEVVYAVEEPVDVAPGRYELRVSAASDRLARGGSVYLDVNVPDLRGPSPTIGGIALAYADGPRVPVAPPSVRKPRALPFAPTLDRVFHSSDTLHAYADAVSRATPVKASIQILDASGTKVRDIEPRFTAGDPVRIEGLIALSGLPAGGYMLRVIVADGSRSATRDVGFAVR